MRARFINEEWYNDLERLVDDIFGIWDEWNDDRDGIGKVMSGWPGSGIEAIRFEFPYGWSDDFYVDVNQYLKDYKLKHFENIEPFKWNWEDQSLEIKPV